MRGEGKRIAFIFFIIIAITFLSYVTSFAGTTTYQYDDVNRKVRIEHGTPAYSISGIIADNNGNAIAGVTMTLTGTASGTTTTDSTGFGTARLSGTGLN